jgi:hypothetical protein
MTRQKRATWAWMPVLLLAALTSVSCDYLGEGLGLQDQAAETAAAAPALTPVDAGPLAGFIATIPAADVRDLDLETALTLVAMPLSCLDRPHAAPRDRSTYLDEFVTARRPGYERERAFYGCWDWHSAVNSTWAMVRIYKEFPDLPVAGLVQEKLNDHLSAQAMKGELEFFQQAGGFERPYGWAWLLQLYAELRTWDHHDAERWANNVQPLAELFSERMVPYLERLERPSRSGAHTNTAFSLAMMLDYARTMDEVALRDAIVEASGRLFGADVGCPTAYEPWGSDFLSPCLEEAALMADVLDPEAFVAWFDEFMPAVDSPEFVSLTTPVYSSEPDEAEPGEAEPAVAEAPAEESEAVMPAAAEEPAEEPGAEGTEGVAEDTSEEDAEEARRAEEIRELGGRSHLIGLAFIRGDAMIRIASALPAGDPRIEVFHRLAALHATIGFDAMFDASYAGSHWIGTFALKYLLIDPER